ncbi:M48 family metalloprotease [bacterium]|nr:M48 family metalloprotease [bacterium]
MRAASSTRSIIWTLALLVITCAFVTAPVSATTLEEEIDLGKKLDVEILREYEQVKDEASIKEIDEYGQQLVKGSSINRPEIKYTFRILKQDDLNAFSTPGGYVYFSSHLWDVLRPNERKGVIAHEIVHIDRRHAIDAASKANRQSMWIGAILTVLGANRSVGDLIGMAHNFAVLNYSRGDEKQADEVGVQLLHEAGYNPAGLLLAMRKINRFQIEAGGEGPKYLSNHPLTKERLAYLTADLEKMGVPVPAEDVNEIPNPNTIGSVTSVSGMTVQFSSSKKLRPGDIVWLMGQGWDYRYENHIAVPVARGSVTDAGSSYSAQIALMSGVKADKIAVGTDVCALPAPEAASGIATMENGKVISKSQMKKFDRLVALQQVWNDTSDKVVNDNAGYVIITDPKNPTGYVAATRSEYSYAPVERGSVLVKLNDPDEKRWAGTIISIGRGGQTIEVLPDKGLNTDTTYEVTYPAWNSKAKYDDRVIGTAKLSSASGKIVMKMRMFMPGRSMADIQNGFDVYEEKNRPETK